MREVKGVRDAHELRFFRGAPWLVDRSLRSRLASAPTPAPIVRRGTCLRDNDKLSDILVVEPVFTSKR